MNFCHSVWDLYFTDLVNVWVLAACERTTLPVYDHDACIGGGTRIERSGRERPKYTLIGPFSLLSLSESAAGLFFDVEGFGLLESEGGASLRIESESSCSECIASAIVRSARIWASIVVVSSLACDRVHIICVPALHSTHPISRASLPSQRPKCPQTPS